MYKILLDWRAFPIKQRPAIIEGDCAFLIVAVVQSMGIIPETYVCLISNEPEEKLYIERLPKKHILSLERSPFSVNDLVHIDDDEEWNLVYSFLKKEGFFDPFINNVNNWNKIMNQLPEINPDEPTSSI